FGAVGSRNSLPRSADIIQTTQITASTGKDTARIKLWSNAAVKSPCARDVTVRSPPHNGQSNPKRLLKQTTNPESVGSTAAMAAVPTAAKIPTWAGLTQSFEPSVERGCVTWFF